MYDEYDDGAEGGASLGRKIALGIGVVAIAAAGFFAFQAVTGDDEPEQVSPASGSSAPDGSTTDDTDDGAGVAGGATTDAPDDTVVDSTAAPSTSAAPSTTEAATTTAAPTTEAPPTSAAAPPPAPGPVSYDTLPDGSPAWVTALFGPDKITITGAVPDQAAKDRLQTLALANAKPGQGTVENLVVINPAVPRSVGVRVVELTSIRFPDGSAEILPPHQLELDRVVGIMNALPHITALVIGHADQRGDELSNFVISEARADAVTNYLASRGIAPSRLASRAVGEADLLTLNDDAAALELNRRTEFVFYGLLI